MTIAPDVPRVSFAGLPQAVQELRRQGLRLSTPRRLTLEALFAASGPVSAEHVANSLALDIASVYRNLEIMERHGVVRHVHLGHGPGLYALVGEGEQEDLYCERCGTVRALSPAELEPVRAKISEMFGHTARFTHFPIVGLCQDCEHAGSTGGSRSTPEARPPAPHHEHPHHGHPHHHAGGPSHQHSHSHGDHVHSHPHEHPIARED